MQVTLKRVVDDVTLEIEEVTDILPLTKKKKNVLSYGKESSLWGRDNGTYEM